MKMLYQKAEAFFKAFDICFLSCQDAGHYHHPRKFPHAPSQATPDPTT